MHPSPLQRLATAGGGRLDGLDFNLKSKGSLYRKLVQRLDRLLNRNEHIPEYTPSMQQVTNEVDDCLRYTIVSCWHRRRRQRRRKGARQLLLFGPNPICFSISFLTSPLLFLDHPLLLLVLELLRLLTFFVMLQVYPLEKYTLGTRGVVDELLGSNAATNLNVYNFWS